jgi:hypothetical protein
MKLDTWILMEKTALQIVWDAAHPADEDASIPDNAKLLVQGIRGYWKDITSGPDTYEVVNVMAMLDEIEQFEADHTADILDIFTWEQVTRLDALEETDRQGVERWYPTDPTVVLSVMNDHITYDQDGNPTGSTPPDFNNPNWGHVFVNSSPSSERIFAGAFTTGFSRGFK